MHSAVFSPPRWRSAAFSRRRPWPPAFAAWRGCHALWAPPLILWPASAAPCGPASSWHYSRRGRSAWPGRPPLRPARPAPLLLALARPLLGAAPAAVLGTSRGGLLRPVFWPRLLPAARACAEPVPPSAPLLAPDRSSRQVLDLLCRLTIVPHPLGAQLWRGRPWSLAPRFFPELRCARQPLGAKTRASILRHRTTVFAGSTTPRRCATLTLPRARAVRAICGRLICGVRRAALGGHLRGAESPLLSCRRPSLKWRVCALIWSGCRCRPGPRHVSVFWTNPNHLRTIHTWLGMSPCDRDACDYRQ